MRFTAAFAACLAALVMPACRAANAIDVTVDAARDKAEIFFDAARPFRFSLLSFHNPERALLDLEGVGIDAHLEEIARAIRAQVAAPRVHGISVHRSGAHSVRIEFAFDEEVEPAVSAHRVKGGHYRLALLLQPATAGPAPPSAPLSPAPGPFEEALADVTVNGQPPRSAVLLERADGKVLISEADLASWRLRPPSAPAQRKDGLRYFPLDTVRGLSYRFDRSTQSLSVEASPGSFETTRLMGAVAGFSKPSPPPPGAYANYDVFFQGERGSTTGSAMLDLGAFGRWGAGDTDFIGRRDPAQTRVTRLESTWRYDRPESLETWRLGDSTTRAGAWGRSVRVGGVQWSTNFATQPAFVPFPLPGLSGQAVVPSTVDLFVNNALSLRRDVPAGPFSISDLPVVTGSGEARIVVRDALGREQVVSQPYYVSPSLLKQGLHDYSYEAGFVRRNFGLASNDYGEAAAVATHRFGLTDRTTLEARAEVLRHRTAIGGSASALLGGAGVLTASAAVSHGSLGTGALAAVGFAHEGRLFSLGGSAQYATDHFTQMGLEAYGAAPRVLANGFAGLSLGARGSLSVAYAGQEFRDRPPIRLLSASYGKTIEGLGFASISVMQSLATPRGTSVALTITRPLDASTAASAGARRESGGTNGSVEVQRSLPVGPGWGYHVLAETGRSARDEAGLAVQNNVGTYTAEATRSRGSTAYRASASGGLAFLGGSVFASRRMADSFAVVQVPGFAGVRVYADNQLVGRTSSSGNMLVPRLLPYVKTAVRIEPADLPLDTVLDSAQLEAVPYQGSALLLRFPVKRSSGATFKVLLDDGKPVPAGAIARLGSEAGEFPVALQGEVYMTGLSTGANQVSVAWHGRSCAFTVSLAAGDDPLPDLGEFRCRGVAR
ncbi:MAG TPA: fimbria/pilus outer membrane usher protein [Usitatibacter sp.]|jgi:outer membrane usher protein|nr:fimbria/pilus outer membrane usher protein [Usitatibacter sp.]